MSADKPNPGRYKTSVINLRTFILAAVTVVFLLIVSLLVLNEYFLSVDEQQTEDTALKPGSVTMSALRLTEDEILNSYKLLDSARGVYRIPVERAMELVAQETYQTSAKK